MMMTAQSPNDHQRDLKEKAKMVEKLQLVAEIAFWSANGD
jgi:hypothetical protein